MNDKPKIYRCAECGAPLKSPRQIHTDVDCKHFKSTREVYDHGLVELPQGGRHGNCKDRREEQI